MNIHDPGGAIRYAVTDDVFGKAVFAGENDCHRLMLSRQLGVSEIVEPYVLFVGMNPSVASSQIDDPTVRREWNFTRRWGFSAMVKCNVMSYRATFPKDLLSPDVEPSIPENINVIRNQASRSSLIVCCWGAVHYKLKRYASEVESVLREDGRTLHCFGLTKSGMPRHPLYLASDTPLVKF